MTRAPLRRLASWLVAAPLLGVLAQASAAAPGGFEAELSCRPEAAPGRVLCELVYRAAPGTRLVWADAVVTRSPDFARPLRSRLSPERFGGDGLTERKLGLAFVASQNGVGPVTVRARAVVCRGPAGAESCRPETWQLSAELRVGS
jgi:hypothetical protein